MNGVRIATWVMAASLLAATAQNASATVLKTLTFSGATFTGGGTLDGYFTYDYAANTVPTLVSFDIVTTAGVSAPGFSYVRNVAGEANTVSQYLIDDWNFAVDYYEVQIYKPGGAIYLDWIGVGTQAVLKIDMFYLGIQAASAEPYNNGHSNRFLSSAGTSIGYDGAFVAVPEPASAALLFAGLAPFVIRRRRLDAAAA